MTTVQWCTRHLCSTTTTTTTTLSSLSIRAVQCCVSVQNNNMVKCRNAEIQAMAILLICAKYCVYTTSGVATAFSNRGYYSITLPYCYHREQYIMYYDIHFYLYILCTQQYLCKFSQYFSRLNKCSLLI